MKKIVYLIIFLGLLLVPIAMAENPIFKNSDVVDLKVPCFNNNTYCSNIANCNITIFYPDNSILIQNQNMTNQISYFNYTLTENLTEQNGEYVVNVICQDGSYNGYSTLNFEITPSGTIPSDAQTMVYFIIIAVLLGLFIITLVGGVNMEKDEYYVMMGGNRDMEIKINYKKYLRIFLFFLAYELIVFISVMVHALAQNMLFLSFAEPILWVVMMILLIAQFPIIFISVIFTIAKTMHDFKLFKLGQRGLSPR